MTNIIRPYSLNPWTTDPQDCGHGYRCMRCYLLDGVWLVDESVPDRPLGPSEREAIARRHLGARGTGWPVRGHLI